MHAKYQIIKWTNFNLISITITGNLIFVFARRLLFSNQVQSLVGIITGLLLHYQGIHLLIHHHQMFYFACIALQNRIAKLFDKEAALFVPTGTMGNLISGQYRMYY